MTEHHAAVSTYPKTVLPGDLVCIRWAGDGWFTDAGTIRRGKNGRHWSTVTKVELVQGQYRIHNSGHIPVIFSAPNAKVLVRRAKRTFDGLALDVLLNG